MRSRAVSFPASCWRAIRSGPPPSRARARRASRSSTSGRRMDGAPPVAGPVSVAMGRVLGSGIGAVGSG